MTPRQQEIADAVRQHGSHRKAAAALGVHHATIDQAMKKARHDPAWEAAAAAKGFDPTHAGWIKWPAKDGEPGASVYVRPDRNDMLAGLTAALEAYEGRAEPSPPPQFADVDLLNLVAIPDWHAGMHAWRRETGADYDLRIAGEVLRDTIGRVILRLPPAAHGVILAPGDVVHANDARNVTPRSHHQLDVDGRHLKVMEAAAAGLIHATEMMLEHHDSVDLVILGGNHDQDAALMLALALCLFFSREDRVTVHDGAGLWWVKQHGRCMIASTHGHQIKQRDMGPYIAAEWPEMWGATRHRVVLSGHVHHERTVETPGMLCEALRPITARDAYAAGAYQSQREMTGMTFHQERGRVSRIYEAIA